MSKKTLLLEATKFQVAAMNFIQASLQEQNKNATFAKCEIICAFSVDGFLGALGAATLGSTMGIVRSTRALFETFIDIKLIEKSGNPLPLLVEFLDYSNVERVKLKRIHKQAHLITTEETAAIARFTDPSTGHTFKHWSRIGKVEPRAKAVGEEAAYNSLYRLASLATHGSSAFALFYRNSQELLKMQESSLILAMSFTFEIINRCCVFSNVKDPALLGHVNTMRIIKERFIK